jgi:putative PLP-dependent aminotransferase (TIGR04422 family)
MKCYQWPLPQINDSFKKELLSFEKLRKKIDIIESFFEKRFSTPAVLLPSGRSCISAILKINNISRGDIVWAPKWSSHCVWNTITNYATPTVNAYDQARVFLVVHKWGHEHTLCREFNNNKIIIEDSVDSLMLAGKDLFPNAGDYEVFSLSKLIGSYSGGILICKDIANYDLAKELQKKTLRLGAEQAYLKYLSYKEPDSKCTFGLWQFREHENFSLDINSLYNIERCLNNYEKHININLDRLEYAEKLGLYSVSFTDRLPIQLHLNQRHFNTDNDFVMNRMMNTSQVYSDNEIYEKHYLVPLHFGVEQELFLKIIKSITRVN